MTCCKNKLKTTYLHKVVFLWAFGLCCNCSVFTYIFIIEDFNVLYCTIWRKSISKKHSNLMGERRSRKLKWNVIICKLKRSILYFFLDLWYFDIKYLCFLIWFGRSDRLFVNHPASLNWNCLLTDNLSLRTEGMEGIRTGCITPKSPRWNPYTITFIIFNIRIFIVWFT